MYNFLMLLLLSLLLANSAMPLPSANQLAVCFPGDLTTITEGSIYGATDGKISHLSSSAAFNDDASYPTMIHTLAQRDAAILTNNDLTMPSMSQQSTLDAFELFDSVLEAANQSAASKPNNQNLRMTEEPHNNLTSTPAPQELLLTKRSIELQIQRVLMIDLLKRWIPVSREFRAELDLFARRFEEIENEIARLKGTPHSA